VPGQQGQAPGKQHGRFRLDDLSPTQLVLLSFVPTPFVAERGEVGSDRSGQGYLLGLMVSRSRGSVELRLHQGHWRLHGREKMYLTPLCSIVSAVREFNALLNVKHVKLMPSLLASPEHASGTSAGAGADGGAGTASAALAGLGDKFTKWLEESFNDSQRAAIIEATTNRGFTLVKGPPGTGKTATLKGMLNALHMREYQRFYKAIVEIAEKDDGFGTEVRAVRPHCSRHRVYGTMVWRYTGECWRALTLCSILSTQRHQVAWQNYSKLKPRLLVAAPSNVAVDNIVSRIMSDGFLDGEGARRAVKGARGRGRKGPAGKGCTRRA
jgi:senataxin